ncbi:MAG: hypothetical protein K2N07_01830 [Desulfovibrio sp.]|nr:hypothetical protein [Desulfovibrio sp.]
MLEVTAMLKEIFRCGIVHVKPLLHWQVREFGNNMLVKLVAQVVTGFFHPSRGGRIMRQPVEFLQGKREEPVFFERDAEQFAA